MINTLIKRDLYCTLLSLSMQQVAFADIAIVVHPSNTEAADANKIRRIFLGKTKAFSNGEKVQTFDLPKGDKAREVFREEVLRKSESRLNSYWARMLFSSKAQPPKELSGPDEIKEIVASNVNAISYLDSVDVDASVRVIMTLK
ncbi:MAG: phosphate ABC transporter substrate-binding protein [Pseudomonadales bacterium]|nr:phosphate ABC transporter substrate-binding protein [Pseudomonadales bacterium]